MAGKYLGFLQGYKHSIFSSFNFIFIILVHIIFIFSGMHVHICIQVGMPLYGIFVPKFQNYLPEI